MSRSCQGHVNNVISSHVCQCQSQPTKLNKQRRKHEEEGRRRLWSCHHGFNIFLKRKKRKKMKKKKLKKVKKVKKKLKKN